ncbi:hypothetical protein AU381_22380 [Sinorhizobium glycinis]|uniref:Uncharacterized protein n=1 Tax=Sinorhizobium glycinis TaxID=1472378 RepID=A0A178XU48_9HYPH|nr:hypothetical protein [Sinorhizobium glycinis]OAP38323.1 hypothetical protein AU381_22380 [Sinorhizobium glycinis]
MVLPVLAHGANDYMTAVEAEADGESGHCDCSFLDGELFKMSYSLMITLRATRFYERATHVYMLVGKVQQHAARVAKALPLGIADLLS